MRKTVYVIVDGLADLPVDGETPLSAANKPNLDWLAKNGSTKDATYNFPVVKESGDFQAEIGTSKTSARKAHEKTPNQKIGVVSAGNN